MHPQSLPYSQADEQYVAACLGRIPKGVVGVAARRTLGEPIVIINHPLVAHAETLQPFPTLYWLIDPDLNAAISNIERKGGVRDIQQAIADDPTLQAAHREDNRLYAKTRWALLSDTEQQTAKDLDLTPILKHAGIGGVAKHDTVKCLHTQYAFHLARHDTGTTAGRLMQTRFNLPN